MLINRTNIKLSPDKSRVIIRAFLPYKKKENSRVIARIMSLTDKQVAQELAKVKERFSYRHFDTELILQNNYQAVKQYMLTDIEPTMERQLLIGAYFTSEYSLESAALFNPSIVPHFDQQNISKGSLRFIMSLRAVGEGHISSVTFRTGVINADSSITMEKAAPFVTSPPPIKGLQHERESLSNKLFEMGIYNNYTEMVIQHLPIAYTENDIIIALNKVDGEAPRLAKEHSLTKEALELLVSANYQLHFDSRLPLSARVLFPHSLTEREGMEDARFTLFTDDNGLKTYYAMYTAWSGSHTLPQMLETSDFLHFKMHSLHGKSISDKGMALFPEKIDGQFACLTRHDGENMYIIFSDDITTWRESIPLIRPSYPWEMVKVGNCGSPVLIDDGWLVLTHGVGPMRRYCLGAVLLDRNDPTKVIGRLKKPLLEPNENEREGYVPNVVYSCGCMAFNGKLILPYAMADYATRIAIVDINNLVSALH